MGGEPYCATRLGIAWQVKNETRQRGSAIDQGTRQVLRTCIHTLVVDLRRAEHRKTAIVDG